MPSKLVADRQKSSQSVFAAIDHVAAAVGRAVTLRLSPMLREGESMPDAGMLLILVRRELESRLDALRAASKALQQELEDDSAPRAARDAAFERLSRRVVELRELLIGLFGRDAIVELGFSERTPQDPVLLAEFASKIADSLRTRPMPAPRLAGVVFPAAATAGELDALSTDLQDRLAVVKLEERQAQDALGVRNQAQESYDTSFSELAELGMILLRLAGRDDLAARLRPTEPRSPSRAEETPPTEPPKPPKAPAPAATTAATTAATPQA